MNVQILYLFFFPMNKEVSIPLNKVRHTIHSNLLIVGPSESNHCPENRSNLTKEAYRTLKLKVTKVI